MTRSVLFDLDGTLTDPKPGITGCIAHALRELGHEPPCADDLEWCIGPPLFRSFPILLGTDDAPLVERAVALYRERFSDVGLYENAVYAGVPEMLACARQKGCRLFVATSKPTVFARRIVEHFDLASLFEGVYGSELDGMRCDKGELIAHVLEVEGLDLDETIMVGDREHDMIGAARCGVRGIGVLYGYGSREELLASGAAALCERPEDVLDHI